ncbi:hypothetical protein [Streptomyces xanthophaeus]
MAALVSGLAGHRLVTPVGTGGVDKPTRGTGGKRAICDASGIALGLELLAAALAAQSQGERAATAYGTFLPATLADPHLALGELCSLREQRGAGAGG